jgi:hypothetical protein
MEVDRPAKARAAADESRSQPSQVSATPEPEPVRAQIEASVPVSTSEVKNVKIQTRKMANAFDVPSEPANGLEYPETSKELDVLGRLYTLFESRSAWLWAPLKAHLKTQVDDAMLSRLLPFVAYQWTDGPWARAYTRFGWDPRADGEDAMWLQTIAFTDPHFRQPGAEKPVDVSQAVEYEFKKPPVCRVQYYQLEDLTDTFIQDVVESCDLEEECDPKFGWLPDAILDAVRSRMVFKSHELRQKIASRNSAQKAGPSKTTAVRRKSS